MYFFILICVIVLVFYFFGKEINHRWFAFFMDQFTKASHPKYDELKKDLFKPIHSHVSNDPELRKKKELRILEIGVGTGANFQHYPDGTNLIVIDPNPHFAKYYDTNRSQFPNIKSEKIIVCGGEDMDMVESNSIDIVVLTLVLCSVKDVPTVLKQICRVLAPGGKLFFMEHILEFEENQRMRATIQNLVTVSGIWPFFLDGCHSNRDMREDIESTGFSNVDARRIHAPFSSFLFRYFLSPHLLGVATK